MNYEPYQIVDSYRTEILSICPAASMKDEPRAVVTVRFPEGPTPWSPLNLFITKAQALRLHKVLGEFFSDPNSWLHATEEELEFQEHLP